MTRTLRILSIAIASLCAAVMPALGQPLSVTVSSSNGSFIPGQGGSATLTANAIGQPVIAFATVRYTGSTTATISGISLSGGSGMSLASTPAFPITLNPNTSSAFTIQYQPANGGNVSSLVSINFTENSQPSVFSFTVIGTAPDLAFSAFVLPNGTQTALSSGDRITFPATTLGSSATATVQVINRGGAAGALQSLVVSGADFQVTGSPIPTTLQPGGQASFNVVFTPRAAGSSSGSVSIGLGTTSFVVLLSGTAGAPDLVISYRFADNNVRTLTEGTTLSFPSVDVNATTAATVDVVNQGTAAGTLTGISVSGVSFQLNGVPQLPTTIPAGQSVRFAILFAPTRTGSYNGTFRIDLTGRSISGTLVASTAPSNLTLSYIEPDTNNVLPLQNGSTLQIPNTLAGSTSVVTLSAGNTGTGTGSINSITLAGGAQSLQLVSLPPLPVAVPPSQQVRFGIRFSPQSQQRFSDTLTLDLNGQIITINLQAQSTGPQFAYSFGNASTPTSLTPGATIALPDTVVGQTSSLGLAVSNLGTGDGQISVLNVSGQSLSLTELPTLPFTVRPNGSQRFTLNFAPTQPGVINGRLTIGTETFNITATAVGSKLNYTYINAAAPIPIDENGLILFSPLAVGGTSNLTFSIQNTGTSATTISSINLAAPSQVFTLQQLPALPFNLNPGASASFAIVFSPNNTGTLSATLRINASSFNLSGSGLQPAALPSYQFQGLTGNPQPAQQPTVGLTLSSPYPQALQGTLRLTFVSSVFTDDPSIQFASGGRSVNFTVPANSTRALFNGTATSIPLQTGTTAGNIVLTPSFTLPGGFDLTPASPEALTLTIARAAPQLVNGSVTVQSGTTFTIAINGYSTTRAIRQLDVEITPRPGQAFSSTRLTLDVNSASSAWFQSAASQSQGGSFLVAIPFALSGGSNTTDLVHQIQSLTITATNDAGASSTVTVGIP